MFGRPYLHRVAAQLARMARCQRRSEAAAFGIGVSVLHAP